MHPVNPYAPRPLTHPTGHVILEGTVALLATDGYARTTIGKLSARLGISKGVIHYHFPSKEILMQETIAHIYTNARQFMERQVWQTDNPWTQLATFIELSCKYYAANKPHIKALQELRANFRPTHAESLAETLHAKELRDLEKVIIAGQQSELFFSFDPEIGALILRMALNGAAQKIVHERTQPELPATYARELQATFKRAWVQAARG